MFVPNKKTLLKSRKFTRALAREMEAGERAILRKTKSIAGHTAHHRGALAVYARLLNKVPPMPYE